MDKVSGANAQRLEGLGGIRHVEGTDFDTDVQKLNNRSALAAEIRKGRAEVNNPDRLKKLVADADNTHPEGIKQIGLLQTPSKTPLTLNALADRHERMGDFYDRVPDVAMQGLNERGVTPTQTPNTLTSTPLARNARLRLIDTIMNANKDRDQASIAKKLANQPPGKDLVPVQGRYGMSTRPSSNTWVDRYGARTAAEQLVGTPAGNQILGMAGNDRTPLVDSFAKENPAALPPATLDALKNFKPKATIPAPRAKIPIPTRSIDFASMVKAFAKSKK